MPGRPTNDIKCNNVENESPSLISYFACVTEEHPSSPRQKLDVLPALVNNAGNHYDTTVTPVTTLHNAARQMHPDLPSSGPLTLPGSSKSSKDQAGDRLGRIGEEVNTSPFQLLQRAGVARDKQDSQHPPGSHLSLINSAARIEQRMSQSTTDHSPYPGGNHAPRENADPDAATSTNAVDAGVMPGMALRFKAGSSPAGRRCILNNGINIRIAASGRSVDSEADASGTRNKPRGEASPIDRAHGIGDSCSALGHDGKKEASRTLQRTAENVIIPDSGLEWTALERTGNLKRASVSTINADEEMATVNKSRPLRGNEATPRLYGPEPNSSRDYSELVAAPWQETRSVLTREGITAVAGVLANKIVEADGTLFAEALNEVYQAVSGVEEQARETTATSRLVAPPNVEIVASKVRFRSNEKEKIPKTFLVL